MLAWCKAFGGYLKSSKRKSHFQVLFCVVIIKGALSCFSLFLSTSLYMGTKAKFWQCHKYPGRSYCQACDPSQVLPSFSNVRTLLWLLFLQLTSEGNGKPWSRYSDFRKSHGISQHHASAPLLQTYRAVTARGTCWTQSGQMNELTPKFKGRDSNGNKISHSFLL